MRKLIFIVFLGLVLPVVSQSSLTPSEEDSVLGIWHNDKLVDSVRAEAYKHYLWKGYLFSQPDSAFIYADDLYKFAEEKGLHVYRSKAINIQGVAHYVKGDYSTAIDYFKRCLPIQKEAGDMEMYAATLNNIANTYLLLGNYIEAINIHTESLKLKESIKDTLGIAASLLNIGVINSDQNNLEEALSSYFKSLKLSEAIGDLDNMALCNGNIGNVYRKQNKDELALKYYFKSLDFHTKNNQKKGIAESLGNIGFMYKRNKEYDKAQEYLEKSLNLFREINNQKGVTLGLSYLSDLHYLKGNFEIAIKYGEEGLALAQNIKVVTAIEQSSMSLYKNYKSVGDFKNAALMFELYVSTKDTIRSKEHQQEVIRQGIKYEYDKKSIADSILHVEEEKAQKAEMAKTKAELNQNQKLRFFLFTGVVLVLLFFYLVYRNYRSTQKQKLVIQEQKEIVEEKNQEILDSMEYAKRIQLAILPQDSIIQENLPNSFVLYKPKDIVAGDFYWMEMLSAELRVASAEKAQDGIDELTKNKLSTRHPAPGTILLAAADCTGHGVPGAMVSVVCNNGLNRSVREYGLTDPGDILDKTREIVIQEFEKSEEDVKDGMDIALVSLSPRSPSDSRGAESLIKLSYAGAHNPLWIIRKGATEIEEIKANKQPIGKFSHPEPYKTHEVELSAGDRFYLFSDGYPDQFGGEKGKKFKSGNFKKLLVSLKDENMKDQKETLDQVFEEWRGDIEQIDDVCLIGVEV